MELKLRTNQTLAELTIEIGNGKLIEDLSTYKKDKGWHVEETQIENLLTVAFDMSRFNGTSDVSKVMTIIESFLSDSEQEEVAEILCKNIEEKNLKNIKYERK